MSEKTITELAKNSELFTATTRLTAKKTDELISRGMAITGFVLTDPATNDKLTVDLGQVNTSSATKKRETEPVNAELLSAAAGVLEEAADDVGHWGDYADDYFQKKWGLSEDIKKYKAHAELIRKHLAAGLQVLAGGMCDESCDCDDEDDFDGPEDDCYLGPDGFCGAAGSEHCEWDCPNR